jgi:hypothetical protein
MIDSMSNSEDLWNTALESLTENDRAQLGQDCLDRLQSIAKLTKLTIDAEKRCKEQSWQFKRKSGEVVVVRDVIRKIVKWVEHFQVIGDTIAQIDPAHSALPWAGVQLVLQVSLEVSEDSRVTNQQICVDDFKTYDFLLEKIPVVVELICRCALIEKLLTCTTAPTADLAETDATRHLRRALITLYVTILTYLAQVKIYFDMSRKSSSSQVNGWWSS